LGPVKGVHQIVGQKYPAIGRLRRLRVGWAVKLSGL